MFEHTDRNIRLKGYVINRYLFEIIYTFSTTKMAEIFLNTNTLLQNFLEFFDKSSVYLQRVKFAFSATLWETPYWAFWKFVVTSY